MVLFGGVARAAEPASTTETPAPTPAATATATPTPPVPPGATPAAAPSPKTTETTAPPAFTPAGSTEAQEAEPSPLTLGGYGEAVFQGSRDTRLADVRRMVLYAGYRFSDTARFSSELETEHAREFEVEQLFLELSPLARGPRFQAGLMLVPIGITNLHHEPPTFLGVDRPVVDTLIIPSTWREMGLGATGTLGDDFRWQAALLNGLDGDTFSVDGGIAPARGQGAFAHANEAAGAARLTWHRFLGTELGVSGYYGGAAADVKEIAGAAVGIGEADARFERYGLSLKAEYVRVWIAKADSIVAFQRAIDPTVEAIGSAEEGAYGEAGYDVLHPRHASQSLTPFARFEYADTKAALTGIGNPGGHEPRRYLFAGVVWKPVLKVAVKADYRWALAEPPEDEPDPAATGEAAEEEEESLLHGNVFSLGVGFQF